MQRRLWLPVRTMERDLAFQTPQFFFENGDVLREPNLSPVLAGEGNGKKKREHINDAEREKQYRGRIAEVGRIGEFHDEFGK